MHSGQSDSPVHDLLNLLKYEGMTQFDKQRGITRKSTMSILQNCQERVIRPAGASTSPQTVSNLTSLMP
ncbi:hypothetical protein AOXY_G2521 [Acipenser oxyrinchus oxyrinchus]|uniref:Uncharacterized protein n=1 Tax=Acipenser oxyrinchus oxyrinchus TaxID=40147 RepID=A0AAD8LU92_ACIOX|nr:hypothetical protein AOXY_G2521 [Acipenser oxyrinchus oxyrinchus]